MSGITDIGWIAEPSGTEWDPIQLRHCELVDQISVSTTSLMKFAPVNVRSPEAPRAGVDDPPSPRGSAGHEETSMTVDLEAHSHQTRSTRIDHEALWYEARGINGTVRTRTEVRNAAWTDGDAFRQKTNREVEVIGNGFAGLA